MASKHSCTERDSIETLKIHNATMAQKIDNIEKDVAEAKKDGKETKELLLALPEKLREQFDKVYVHKEWANEFARGVDAKISSIYDKNKLQDDEIKSVKKDFKDFTMFLLTKIGPLAIGIGGILYAIGIKLGWF
jgi:uncharacterized coiled-coil protein SlyX